MPPQDSQTLTESASDRIITFPNDDVHVPEDEQSNHTDFPPESFWLSKDAELDWFDRNAFFDRKDSTKATNPNHNHNSNPSSQRFSVATKKSKTSIIGLPKPQQKSCFVDARHRRNQTNTRLFPKRGSAEVINSGKQEAPMAEPSSPKVSCMGRVRSRRDRNRRLKNRQQSLKSSSEKITATANEQRRKKKGLWKNLRSIFRSGSGRKPVPEPDSKKTQAKAKNAYASRSHVLSREGSGAVVSASPPGLGGLARFSSGRRSDAWVGDVAEIMSGPLDGRTASLQKRREAGPLKEVDVNCGRNWGSVGPASV